VVSGQIDKVNDAAHRVRDALDVVLAADLNAVLDAATEVADALSAWYTSRTTTGLDDLAHALNEVSNIRQGPRSCRSRSDGRQVPPRQLGHPELAAVPD
jgi:hypothetical protein